MSEKVRVGFLVHNFNVGGVQKANIRMINGLDKNKFQIYVIYSGDGPLFKELMLDSLHLYRIGEDISLYSVKNFITLKKLVSYIKFNKIQLIHSIDQVFYMLGAIAARITGIKHIRTQPNFIKRHERLNAKTFKITPFNKWTDCYITYQNASAKDLINLGVNEKRIYTLLSFSKKEEFLYYTPMNLDLKQEIDIPSDSKLILAMHRMVPGKGFEKFLDMARIISRSRDDVYFILVGDGPLRRSLEEYSETLKISKQVRFLGFRKDIVDIIKQCDLGVYPVADTAAMVETIISGKILITKKNSSMDEYIVDGVTGFLLEDKPEIYAQKVLELIDNSEKIMEMENNTKNFVLQYLDGETNLRRLEEIFFVTLRNN